jgi:uncharacterized protein (DUF302 family)
MDVKTVMLAAASRPSFQTVVRSVHDFDTTVACLKQAIAAHDLWLIHEIDPQMLLRRAGLDIPAARQLLFFHPRYMMRLLAIDPAAVTEVPIKLVALQAADGTVDVHHPRIDLQLARYAGFDSLGGELADLGVAIATTVGA